MPADTPLWAVRRKCLACRCGSAQEVKLCPVQACPLWPHRLEESPADHRGPSRCCGLYT